MLPPKTNNLQIYMIYGVLGRSGTTILRNIIAQNPNIGVPHTAAAQDFFYSLKNRAQSQWNDLYSKFLHQDIRTLYGNGLVLGPTAVPQSILGKFPLSFILHNINLSVALNCKPIFILRHPIGVALSSSKPEFLKDATPRDKVYELILNSLRNINPAFASIPPFPKDAPPHVQAAHLINANLTLYEMFFNLPNSPKPMIIKLENLCQNPKKNLMSLEKFLSVEPGSLYKNYDRVIFKPITEEGGILMHQPLNADSIMRVYDGISDCVMDEIWEILQISASRLGYNRNILN